MLDVQDDLNVFFNTWMVVNSCSTWSYEPGNSGTGIDDSRVRRGELPSVCRILANGSRTKRDGFLKQVLQSTWGAVQYSTDISFRRDPPLMRAVGNDEIFLGGPRPSVNMAVERLDVVAQKALDATTFGRTCTVVRLGDVLNGPTSRPAAEGTIAVSRPGLGGDEHVNFTQPVFLGALAACSAAV